MPKQSLIIVGAGISGLYLASKLEKYYNVTILEARERIGGRIYEMNAHDMGPSWVWKHHVNILKLLQEYQLTTFKQYNHGYALYDNGQNVEKFQAPHTPESFRVEGTLFSLIKKIYTSLETCKIHLNTPVKSIDTTGSTIELTSHKQIFNAHKVILTLPPRLTSRIHFNSALPSSLHNTLRNTQTWMGNSAKCVVVFKEAFWKTLGLSGFVFSNVGPLSEIHDASTKESAALFGFVSLKEDMSTIKSRVLQQMLRLFSISKEDIINIYVVDWKTQSYTAVSEDAQARGTHPEYGIDMSEYHENVFFSATEFSFQEGGYLEGALIQANKTLDIIKKQYC